jgi:hypothetical protein
MNDTAVLIAFKCKLSYFRNKNQKSIRGKDENVSYHSSLFAVYVIRPGKTPVKC